MACFHLTVPLFVVTAPKAVPAFAGSNQGLNHLGIDEVAVEFNFVSHESQPV
jgi:hypothetical protein